MNRQQTETPDFLFLLLTVVLLGFGLAMVFSASSMTASYHFDDIWHYVFKQLTFAGIGFIALIIAFKFPLDRLRKMYPLILLATIGMLMLVLMIGETVNGAKSWFGFGSFGIQPTEFAKIGLIIYLAAFISKKGDQYRDFKKGMLRTILVLGMICSLIALQPDVGSILIIAAAAVIMMFVGGGEWRQFGTLITIGSLLLSMLILYKMSTDPGFFNSYRVQRFTSFIDPWSDPEKTGYHIIQSLYAFGHGALTGTGFGQSIQKLHYLPEAHNDFIFAIIGEEFGFLGTTIFVLTYLAFILRGIIIALRCNEPFRMLLGTGIMGLITIQAIVNMFGVAGMMPITGVTLPLISYGGSSLIVTLFSIGLLLNISRTQSKS